MQGLRAPVVPGVRELMHICGIVRHGCVKWGMVSTQDPHTYKTYMLYQIHVRHRCDFVKTFILWLADVKNCMLWVGFVKTCKL